MDNETLKQLAAACVLLLTGCQSPASTLQAMPALLTSTDTGAQAEITSAVSAALGGVPVTLSPTAFTQSSRLYIDQGALRNGQSRVQEGKMLGSPRRFELFRHGGDCFLAGPDTEVLTPLRHVQCKAIVP